MFSFISKTVFPSKSPISLIFARTLRGDPHPLVPVEILRPPPDPPDPPDPNETRAQKLERLADQILNLCRHELHDFNILFRYKLGMQAYGSGASISTGSSPSESAASGSEVAKAAEKSTFDVKLETFDAGSKLKIVKEVRALTTSLGLKEAKDLVDKAPVVVKHQVTKEEADAIVAKFKELGATVKLE